MPPAEREPPPADVSVSDYFPIARGDRWRYRSEPGDEHENVGITGEEAGGVAVLFGTGHALAERYRADRTGASLVAPGGGELVPLLRAPLVPGTTWTYELDEHGTSIPCEGAIVEEGVTRNVGAAAVNDCVVSRRVCRYPSGAPFTQATVHTVVESYCRGVGLVDRTQTFEPPPPAPLGATRTDRLVGFRLATATLPRGDDFSCGDFIVLPSDVRAACGSTVQSLEPFAGAERPRGCRYEFENAGGNISIEARTEPFEENGTVSVHARGAYVNAAAEGSACAALSLRRLEPVLRSLVVAP